MGNIAYTATDDDLRVTFELEGVPVVNARILTQEGKSRGFGFVTIGETMEVSKVIEKMSGVLMKGRSIRVEQATPTARPTKRV